MPEVLERDVLAALATVADAQAGADLVSAGMISSVRIQDGHVSFMITVDPARGPQLESLRQAAERTVAQLAGVTKVSAILTAERPAAPVGGRQTTTGPVQPLPGTSAGAPAAGGQRPLIGRHANMRAIELPNIAAIIAVASGKGGVGKSTTAVNLALAMRKGGHKVGLLDADIYGPSVPRMLGLTGKPKQTDDKKIMPMEAFGLLAMSMGMLLDESQPVIWRGPMATGALEQLMTDVAWGSLDVLVIDMPPGTGDIHLTLAQKVPLTGAVIVTTPQDIALIDARKGLNMFRKVEVPVLGIIENMSYFIAPDTGKRYDIFGAGGGRREAEKLDLELLGEIPLAIPIRETSDDGRPIVVSDPDSEHARIYAHIAERVWAHITAIQAKG